MAAVLYRFGSFTYKYRRLVVAFWLLVLVAIAVASATLKGSTNDTFSVPGTESQRANALLKEKFPGTGGADARIVFAAPSGHTLLEPEYKALVAPTVALARKVPQTVGGSQSFLGPLVVSPDKTVAFADLHFAVPVAQITAATKASLAQVADPARKAGLEVEFSGGVIVSSAKGGGNGDLIGIVIAFIVLSITFSALLAAGLPLATALFGVGVGLLGITAATGIVKLNSSAPTLALMLGLAVGIDYALFIVSRTRENIDDGLDPAEAIPRAIATAGSAVTFAGTTVVIALLGLSVVGIPFLTAMGIAAAVTVLVAVLIALSLLPAFMGFAGKRIARRRRRLPAITLGRRWVVMVTGHPVLVLSGVLGIFAICAFSALHVRQGLPDDRSKPKSSTERRAYDLLTRGFGAGFNGPLLLVIDSAGKSNPTEIGKKAISLLHTAPDVAVISKPLVNPAGDITLIQVTPKSAPSSQTTKDLVRAIRSTAAKVKAEEGVSAYVTGTTASSIDTADKLASALPLFVALVVGLALLLLIVVFRSILIPVTAVVGFLLTIAAALGATTFVFQNGHGLAAIGGGGKTEFITSFVPVLMVAILFGLAMDYEVFLVSRMREAHTRGESAKDAIVNGFTHSARVVTAAAIIMISVFTAFLTDESIIIKEIAFSLAFGILFDAFIVRMTVIPAVHRLLGDHAWWLPRPLARILPDLDIEGEHLPTPAARPTDVPPIVTQSSA
jgi:putative drug exporter of the RND superfamily